MNLKSIADVKRLEGKRVLLRVAYDVPLEKKGQGLVVADDRRILETLPTIQYLLKHHCRIVILSWLKRPGGKVVPEIRMDPVAKKLSQILKKPVKKLDDCIGPKVFAEIQKMKPGEIVMLENVRFYPQEESNSRLFAKLLVHGLDLIVFDAFAQAHRVHASTVGITKLLPTYAGFLLEKELTALGAIIKKPKHPLVVVLGGAKISDKTAVIEQLGKIADAVLIGGGVANVFEKAIGVPIGKSFVEDSFVDKARRRKINVVKAAAKIYRRYQKKILLPRDFLAGNKIDQHALVEIVDVSAGEKISPHWMFLDIGPGAIAQYVALIRRAKTIFFNGPMGVFEIDKFAFGTKKIAEAIARSKALSVVGGGDTEMAVAKYHLEGKFSHVSTGGGASLDFLAHQTLPALRYILKK